jgi:uncharacterized protein YcnI
MKKSLVAGLALAAVIAGTSVASAHVVVSPKEVNVAAFQTFTISVPSEKKSSTIELRLLLPAGLNYVTPTVQPGWNIRVKKEDPANPDRATEIAWFGGSIPAGQRDEFSFSAQVPSDATSLQWKAHQIYADGSVVSWDQTAESQPKDGLGNPDFTKSGPFSETKVVNDVAATETAKPGSASWAGWLSIVALVFSVISLNRSRSVMEKKA